MTAATVRPTPWAIPPDGFHFEAVESDHLEWVVPAASDKGCRFIGADVAHRGACGRPAVASLRRGKAGWWNYCERHLYGRWIEDGKRHLYGRWIEDGKIMHWRLVRDDD